MDSKQKHRLFYILRNDEEFFNSLIKDHSKQIKEKEDSLLANFPFFDFFTLSTNIGETFEKFVEEKIFNDFKRVTAENFDGTLSSTKKIEVKIIRMIDKKKISPEEDSFIFEILDLMEIFHKSFKHTITVETIESYDFFKEKSIKKHKNKQDSFVSFLENKTKTPVRFSVLKKLIDNKEEFSHLLEDSVSFFKFVASEYLKNSDFKEDENSLYLEDFLEKIKSCPHKNLEDFKKCLNELSDFNFDGEADIPSRAKNYFTDLTSKKLNPSSCKNLQNRTFQQVKPSSFDYMIGLAVFKESIEVFIIPSSKIANQVKMDKKEVKNKDLIYLSGQHKGNEYEGQINYNSLTAFKKILITKDPISNNYKIQYFKNGKLTEEIFNLPISLASLL